MVKLTAYKLGVNLRISNMIIVEGVDNSGKSTLCNRLSNYFDYPLIHWDSRPPKTPEELIERIEKIRNSSDKSVFDRHSYVSEFIYGNVIRDGALIDKRRVITEMKKLSAVKKGIILYCRPPDHVILHNERSEMEGVKENYYTLISAYDLLMEELNFYIPVFSYSWYDTSPRQMDQLMLIIRMRHHT